MQHVIITGGSSGIGLAVARIYARRGARLSLIARGRQALEAAELELRALGAPAVHLAFPDVSDEAAIQAAVADCETVLGPCDILVSSAGMVDPGRFETQSREMFDRQVAVNLFGTVAPVRAVYPGMMARRAGRIMIISSGAGLIGIPGYSAYCTSKFALRGFAEALRFEAKPFGVAVSICFPPDTETPQLERERLVRPREAEAIMGRVTPWSAEAVATRLVRALDRGRFEVFFGLTLYLLGKGGPLVRPILHWWFDRAIKTAGRGGR
jgi:NAD(P)-dependent dehydrogenase (short-subunit alcohol dehydrogenase family)